MKFTKTKVFYFIYLFNILPIFSQQNIRIKDAINQNEIPFATILDAHKKIYHANGRGELLAHDLAFPILVRAALYEEKEFQNPDTVLLLKPRYNELEEVLAMPVNLLERLDDYLKRNQENFNQQNDTVYAQLERFCMFRNMENDLDQSQMQQKARLKVVQSSKFKTNWFIDSMFSEIELKEQAVFDTVRINGTIKLIPSVKDLYSYAGLQENLLKKLSKHELAYRKGELEEFRFLRAFEGKYEGYVDEFTFFFKDSSLVQIKTRMGHLEPRPGIRPIISTFNREINYEIVNNQSQIQEIRYSEEQIFSSKDNGGLIPYNLEIVMHEFIQFSPAFYTEQCTKPLKKEEYVIDGFSSGWIEFLFR